MHTFFPKYELSQDSIACLNSVFADKRLTLRVGAWRLNNVTVIYRSTLHRRVGVMGWEQKISLHQFKYDIVSGLTVRLGGVSPMIVGERFEVGLVAVNCTHG